MHNLLNEFYLPYDLFRFRHCNVIGLAKKAIEKFYCFPLDFFERQLLHDPCCRAHEPTTK